MSEQKIDYGQLNLNGELHTDELHKILYATDASVYRELPRGVFYPKNTSDLKRFIAFCTSNLIPIIPRAGGTSLAGQCVGNGFVVDVSKHLNKIIAIDKDRKTVTLQPGVIRDELNHFLEPYNLFFGPNTSTANRAMIGGMVGNNSCGSTSIVYGSTRDHVLELKMILSDGAEVVFRSLSNEEFEEKCERADHEGDIYRYFKSRLNDKVLQKNIWESYPKSSIKRRNTGYALDAILGSAVFTPEGDAINLCKIICGSEGTFGVISEITLSLDEKPPGNEVLVALQFDSIGESLEVIPHIMNHAPFACELMDKTILDCTKGQRLYEKDRNFLKGDPAAVLLVSMVHKVKEETRRRINDLIESLSHTSVSFKHTIVEEHIDRIWNLRKAGLGLLANLPGDKKAVACIEDTAVAIEDLRAYIAEFDEMMKRNGQKSVYYAHAGDGELHLRPILDLKKRADRELFAMISMESAKLVKKYKGSLSGEHGDGRVRAPYIQEVYGDTIYGEFVELKKVWDPNNIFNPGKIVHSKSPIDNLRFDEVHVENTYNTMFDFSKTGGILRAVEKCNGSGDCRKLPLSGGVMCPSYMATRNEKDTTRGRANVLREILTRPKSDNAWNSKVAKDALDLCLSCKGCTSECPSNVDMSTMKAEFLYHYNNINGFSIRDKVFSRIEKVNALAKLFRPVSNFFLTNPIASSLVKRSLGIHAKRTLPKLNKKTLKQLWKQMGAQYRHVDKKSNVYLFTDEFLNYNDEEVGEKAIRLLFSLGYDVRIVDHVESGRSAISKGMLDHAKWCAEQNVGSFKDLIDEDAPLIGIEPSAILTFVDEYPKLVSPNLKEDALALKDHVYTIESFLYQELIKGRIDDSIFTQEEKKILLHGHCHQKALNDIRESAWLLSFPKNYTVEIIPSGCCGMAGSFGYEKEHYDLSMAIGEMVLFPAVRNSKEASIIVASGTSCRHQIKDGTGKVAKHVVEVLYNALTNKNNPIH